jgi:formylglycine-generating enzyme required for sulfatase activity
MLDRIQIRFIAWVCGGTLACGIGKANNIQVNNTTIASINSGEQYALLQFDLSWENSWRHETAPGSGLSHVGIKNGGSGYTTAPTVTISGGGGTGATAVATVDGDRVTEVALTNPGSGYTSAPSVIFSGGGGSGASADAFFQSWWDAAWIFIKYQTSGGEWHHAWLHENGHNVPSNGAIDIGLLDPGSPFDALSNPGLGAFIYRSATGTGSFSVSPVELRWNYGANGLDQNDIVNVVVYALEMVYVPTGKFELGDGHSSTNSSFYSYTSGSTHPSYTVDSENAIQIGTTAGYLYYTPKITDPIRGDAAGPLPAKFPKGYHGFYCMKHEITQQLYADFLNKLTYSQQDSRTASSPNASPGTGALKNPKSTRNGISLNTPGVAASTSAVYGCDLNNNGICNEDHDGQWIACNFLNWSDLAAVLDWMALRPMTELEYEKACRGGASPSQWEYCWGESTVLSTPLLFGNLGTGAEAVRMYSSWTTGYASFSSSNSEGGPLRSGLFANMFNSRIMASASYYGILDMSGNVFEQVITVGDATGRAFGGGHGDGKLSNDGFANVSGWPGAGSAGIGLRGGTWGNTASFMRISDRYWGAEGADWGRDSWLGGRGVRTSP